MNIFMTFNRVAKRENLSINPSSPQKKQKDTLGCYWPGHNCLTTFPCHPPPSPHVAKAPGKGAVPPWRVSSSVALGLLAFSWKDASFSASYHSRVLASAAIFISGSNYGEIQPFISSGKMQKLGGVKGDMNPRVTLGNSSSAPDGWCSAPRRWAAWTGQHQKRKHRQPRPSPQTWLTAHRITLEQRRLDASQTSKSSQLRWAPSLWTS